MGAPFYSHRFLSPTEEIGVRMIQYLSARIDSGLPGLIPSVGVAAGSVVELRTIKSWTCKKTGLVFNYPGSQATRPLKQIGANEGGPDFDGANNYLTAGQVVITAGAWDVFTDFEPDNGTNNMWVLVFLQASGGGLRAAFVPALLNIPSYPTYLFTGQITTGAIASVGSSDARGTARERFDCSFDNVAASSHNSYVARRNEVGITEADFPAGIAGAALNDETAIGALVRGGAVNLLDGRTFEVIVFDHVLSGSDQAIRDAYVTNRNETTEAALDAVAGCVLWLRPDYDTTGVSRLTSKQDGDVKRVEDLSLGGQLVGSNPATTLALASSPFFFHEDPTDGKPSVEFTASQLLDLGVLAADLNGATKAVFSGWIRSTSLAASQRLWSKFDGADNSFIASILTTGALQFIASTSGSDVSNLEKSNAGVIAANGWYFLSYGYNAGVMQFIVVPASTMVPTVYSVANGNATRTGAPAVALRASALSAHFGASQGGTLGLVGKADQLSIIVGQTVDAWTIQRMAQHNPRSG